MCMYANSLYMSFVYIRMYVHTYIRAGNTYTDDEEEGDPETASRDILVGWEKKLGISRFRWPIGRTGWSINICVLYVCTYVCVCGLSNGRKRGPLVFSILCEITHSVDLLFFNRLSLPLSPPSLFFPFVAIPLSFRLCSPSVSYFIDNIVAMDGGHPVLYILKAFSHGYGRTIGSREDNLYCVSFTIY